jgi:hypothetical protein
VFSLVIAGGKIKRGGMSVADVAFLLALVLGVYVMLGSLTGNRLIGLIAVLGILGYLTASPGRGETGRVVVWVALAIFCVSVARPLVEGLVEKLPSTAEVQALNGELRQTPHSRLIIDWWSLRYVFDFRPPADAVYLYNSPHQRPRDGRALVFPGECGVLSADATGQYGLQDPGLPQPAYLRIASRPVGQWIINAGKMALISRGTP